MWIEVRRWFLLPLLWDSLFSHPSPSPIFLIHCERSAFTCSLKAHSSWLNLTHKFIVHRFCWHSRGKGRDGFGKTILKSLPKWPGVAALKGWLPVPRWPLGSPRVSGPKVNWLSAWNELKFNSTYILNICRDKLVPGHTAPFVPLVAGKWIV